MASYEDFQTAGVCNGGWWNHGRNSLFQPCSAPHSDFMWSTSTLNDMDAEAEMKQAAVSYSKSEDSDDHHSSSAEHLSSVLSSDYTQMADFGGVSDWIQTSLIQDSSNMSIFKPVDEQKNSSQNFYNLDHFETATKESSQMMGLQNSASSYAYPALLQSLVRPDADMSYVFDNNNFASATSFMHQPTSIAVNNWPKLSTPSPKRGDTARLWDSFMSSSSDEIGTSPDSHHQLLVPALFEDQKPYNCGNNNFNSRNSSSAPKIDLIKDVVKKSVDSTLLGTNKRKNNTSEEVYKRPRLETPSPLPTFKVRKEKLGDRITALQQLVSPFGKTDTASVLHEAIEYIKFLHDQVSVLRTPYMQNGAPTNQHQQMQSDSKNAAEAPKQDLRSRGLCLVPISSTFPVASETTADFWTPTFGGAMGFR